MALVFQPDVNVRGLPEELRRLFQSPPQGIKSPQLAQTLSFAREVFLLNSHSQRLSVGTLCLFKLLHPPIDHPDLMQDDGDGFRLTQTFKDASRLVVYFQRL